MSCSSDSEASGPLARLPGRPQASLNVNSAHLHCRHHPNWQGAVLEKEGCTLSRQPPCPCPDRTVLPPLKPQSLLLQLMPVLETISAGYLWCVRRTSNPFACFPLS